MGDALHINSRPSPLYGKSLKASQVQENSKDRNSFKELVNSLKLEEKTKVKISSHAMKRIESRNIQMDEKLISNLNDVMQMAKNKGASNTLAMFGDNSFILSVKDRTVVTVVDNKDMESRFFTNIDSVYVNESSETKKDK